MGHPAGSHTCNYGVPGSAVPGYDDLGRLISVDCGTTTWQQNFSYDAFGNITKTVPTGGTGIQWMPGYQGNNRYNLGGTSYDADGNLLNDSFHSMTWNAEGHIVSIGGNCGGSATVCLTYDAFDRVVERNQGSGYHQTLYTPLGKTVIMNGQTLLKAYVPLPGGAVLYYASPSQKQYWHKDWLGSVRLGTLLPGRTEVFDRAYAPFGESFFANLNTSSDYSFAGLTQDTFIVNSTSPNQPYDTDNREYHPIQARWLSPDPAGIGAADMTNPQSWNRYAYVLNNPLLNIDPLGLFCVWDDGSYDSNGDAQSGSSANCAGLGGTWFNGDPSMWDQNAGDWSSQQSGEFASWAQAINPNGVGDEWMTDGTSTTMDGGAAPQVATNDGPGFFTKVNTCVVNNSKNYSIGGVANLIANTQIPGSSLASNSMTDAYTLFTGQDGLLPSVWSATKNGFQWAAAASPPVMTNGPKSFTTINPAHGSPQAILGNGTNYRGLWASAKRFVKSGAELKLAIDAGLTGALALNCSLGQIH